MLFSLTVKKDSSKIDKIKFKRKKIKNEPI